MEARSKYNVPYVSSPRYLFISQIIYSVPYLESHTHSTSQPNLYATPGFHKEADAFNRIQRGHQAFFEHQVVAAFASLIGGLQYPIASSVCSIFYSLGSIFYQLGYGDTKLDVSMARYKKGGALKFVGLFGTMYMSVNLAGKMIGWWGRK
jgi:hypothetical protein